MTRVTGEGPGSEGGERSIWMTGEGWSNQTHVMDLLIMHNTCLVQGNGQRKEQMALLPLHIHILF